MTVSKPQKLFKYIISLINLRNSEFFLETQAPLPEALVCLVLRNLDGRPIFSES